MSQNKTLIKPQAGPQTKFLSKDADIIFYGGAAGGGKTYALLLESLRNIHLKSFGAVIFRRTSKQITNQGGLWDTASELYPHFGGVDRQTNLDWTFKSGMRIKFAHMEHEKNKFDWQGTQIPFIGFDEITHFSRSQFFYMLSRNRSMSGIPGYVRATTNPDATSWVAKFIEWWIDQDTGLPIPERDGVIRWFIKDDDTVIWADTKEELIEKYPLTGKFAKSFTFIHSKITDNKILLDKDPQYLANLHSLDRVERGRLLEGNWKIKAAAGMYFKSYWFEHVDVAPRFVKRIRYWDRASTKKTDTNNPDWTAGVLMSIDDRGVFYVEDVKRLQGTPLEVEQAIKNTATQDGVRTQVGLEQDPGQAGKSEAQYLARQLAGFNVKIYPVSKDKVTRATGFSSQSEALNVKIVHGNWNTDYINELENFPPDSENEKDDQVDASSGAFNALTSDEVARWTSDMNQSSATFSGSFSKGGNDSQW